MVLVDWAAVEAAAADATEVRNMRGEKVADFFASSSQGSNSAMYNDAWADTFDEKSRNAANRWVEPGCRCGDCNAGIGREHFAAKDSNSEDSSDQSEDTDEEVDGSENDSDAAQDAAGYVDAPVEETFRVDSKTVLCQECDDDNFGWQKHELIKEAAAMNATAVNQSDSSEAGCNWWGSIEETFRDWNGADVGRLVMFFGRDKAGAHRFWHRYERQIRRNTPDASSEDT